MNEKLLFSLWFLIGVKPSLFVCGGGDILIHVSVLPYPLVKHNFLKDVNWIFRHLSWLASIQAIFLWWEQRYILPIFNKWHSLPTNTIRVDVFGDLDNTELILVVSLYRGMMRLNFNWQAFKLRAILYLLASRRLIVRHANRPKGQRAAFCFYICRRFRIETNHLILGAR